MKTAKIESYRLCIVSFCNGANRYLIESVSCIVFSNFKKKKKKKKGLITFPFHIATQFAIESLCLLIYMHNNTCFIKKLHYPHFSHTFNVFAK